MVGWHFVHLASAMYFGSSFGERSDDEEAMLAEAFNVRESSRLGCQIPITEDLVGLQVELAPEED